MSSGIGKTQQAVLDALADAEHGNLGVVALSERVGVSTRQIRSALQALEERERVCITREDLTSEWTGDYGDLAISTNTRVTGGGMPPKPVRIVWLPERRTAYLRDWLSTTAARGGSGSPEMVAEYERLTGQPSPTRRAIRRLPYRSQKRYPDFQRTHR